PAEVSPTGGDRGLSPLTPSPEERGGVQDNSTGYISGQAPSLQERAGGEASPSSPTGGDLEGASFKGIPYSSIIAEWWEQTGGEPQVGERNVKLHKLAVSLRAICDNKRDLLMQIMPRLGLSEQELRSIVDSACKEEPKGISKQMQAVLRSAQWREESGESETETEEVEGQGDLGSRLNVRSLPLGLKESLAGVPETMRMPVICSVMPIAAAYADQVEVKYCDGNIQRLGLMSIIRGEQASGKSVCKLAVDVWKRQFDEEDALARKREEEWRERKKARKANEKAPDDPKVLIRTVPVTVSCSTLLRRFKNSGGHCLYSFGEELDTLRKTNGAGSWSSKYDIYRLSFDNGEWGQDYNSDQAESGVVKVAYNWTMLGTDGAMRKCFKQDNIENGLSSRVLVSEMPDSSFSKMPKFGKRTEEDEARIQDAVARLRSAAGFLNTPRLRKVIGQWVEEKRIEAAKDIDRVKDTYRKRAAVIGFRCGVVYYILAGNKHESKSCLEFAKLMAEYALEQQIKAFGEALLNEYEDSVKGSRRYGKNHSIFDQLPPKFSFADLRALKNGACTEQSMRVIISRWRKDGWIERDENKLWKKCNISNI
nr:VirE protein [Prevotella sp.]